MSRLKELLERVRARSALLDQQKELSMQADVISQKIDLNPNRRSDNLRLLRAYINANQQDFVKMLRLGSQSGYSKIERGEAPLGLGDARRIESELNLPYGWFERNNGDAMLFLSNDEFRLVQTIRQSPAAATIAVTDVIGKFRKKREVM